MRMNKVWLTGFASCLLTTVLFCSVVQADVQPVGNNSLYGRAMLGAIPPKQQHKQVDGYYRMMLGDYEVTALYDGYTKIDNNQLIDISADDASQLLQKMFINGEQGVQTAVNAFLIHTNDNLILIDTGAANCFGDTLGQINGNLSLAGYDPEHVDSILLTHLHPDHACGLVQKGKALFPNAILYVAKAEADFWLSDDIAKQIPDKMKGLFKMAKDAIAPYKAAERFVTFTNELPLINNVKLVPTPGHTPGHMSYQISSGGESLLILGDIVHNYAVQFAKPDVAIEFDSDPKQAVISRKNILDFAAINKLWVAGAHLPFPGLGHVSKSDTGYRWVPIEYQPIIKK
ncbi:MBL fold metallo-hydrolase [Orbus wheelerorum]|uniref:MBL fold metallo-hydrolase n=1 Tax=Orbus wheelerorum TaxID=3074111 RepID=UPI00370D493A